MLAEQIMLQSGRLKLHLDWDPQANGTAIFLLLGNECRQINGAFAVFLQLPGKGDALAGLHR